MTWEGRDLFDLDDRVVIMTGGANGLGRVYSEALSALGARLVIADLDAAAADFADELNEAAGELRAVATKVDVTSEPDTIAMVECAMGAFGRVDVLVNNAGSYPHTPFDHIGYDAWRRVLVVNVDSAFLCAKAVMPYMRAQGSGKIVNVATNLVWTGLGEMVHYVTAKAAVVGLTRSLARAAGDWGVTVNAIAPGAVVPDTLTEAARLRAELIVNYQCLKRGLQPEDLVGGVVFLSAPASNLLTGQVLTIDGGLTMH